MNKLVRLFSHKGCSTLFDGDFSLQRVLFLTVILSGLIACGGGSDSQKGLLGVEPMLSPTVVVTPSPTVETVAPATPTVEPTPSSDPTSTIEPAPTSAPMPGDLLLPTIRSSGEGGVLSLSWNDTNAQSYRVLFWLEGEILPEVKLTTALQFSIDVDSGQYVVILEAYDRFGSSLFSLPNIVEVTP